MLLVFGQKPKYWSNSNFDLMIAIAIAKTFKNLFVVMEAGTSVHRFIAMHPIHVDIFR